MYRSGGLQQRTLNESCFHVINIISFPVFGGCFSNRGALWASARFELMYAFMEKSVSMYVICRRRNYTASHLVFYGQLKKSHINKKKNRQKEARRAVIWVLCDQRPTTGILQNWMIGGERGLK